MRRFTLVLFVALMPTVALAWPWSTDMMNQPSVKPQEGEMAPFPSRSVSVNGVATQATNREESKSLENPVPVSEKSLRDGKVLFKIYCAACHGLTGKADSPVSAMVGAIPLTDSYVQETLTEGWLYGTITFGSYVMPAYGVPTAREDNRGSNDLSVEERWHVVNYLRNGLVSDAKESIVSVKGGNDASAEDGQPSETH